MLSRPGLLLASVYARAAFADDDPTRRRFDPDPTRMAFSLDPGFTTETAANAPQGTYRFAAILDATGGLLVLQQGSERHDLLASRGLLHLMGGWSMGLLELGAELP